MNTILVTGSNRGLGLEWVRQYARDGWRVYATCRFPDQADELLELSDQNEHVTVHRLDVTNIEEIEALSHEIGDVVQVSVRRSDGLSKLEVKLGALE